MARVVWGAKRNDGGWESGLALPAGTEHEHTWLRDLARSLGCYDGEAQRRAHIRASAEIDGSLTIESDETQETHRVAVLNLGMGGALLRSRENFSPNDQFALVLGPFHDLPQIELRGSILRASKDPKQGCIFYPSRFRPLEGRDGKGLEEYIFKLLGDV
jgi:c-di-GMP-binding flagellar brake protein YcgR